jgi:hypothetical protein
VICAALCAPAVIALPASQASTSVSIATPPVKKGVGRYPRLATAIADRTEAAQRVKSEHPAVKASADFYAPGRWTVVYSKAPGKPLLEVDVDTRSRTLAGGRVDAIWLGAQSAFPMARGYSGWFGGKLNAPYVWLPLCLLFLLTFLDPRHLLSLRHLDMLVLLGFGVSQIYFNRGQIGVSAPLVYPVLLYLLARMLAIGFRPKPNANANGRIPWLPTWALATLLVMAIGAGITLTYARSETAYYVGVGRISTSTDIAFAGVAGADRIKRGEQLYEAGKDGDGHFDTYGPVNYLAYIPFEAAFPFSGKWDDLPAAKAMSTTFYLVTALGLFLLGRRFRRREDGTRFGMALALGWSSYPYAIYGLVSATNDALIAALIVFAVIAIGSAPMRGLLAGLGTAAKFAPLALVPLLAGGYERLKLRTTAIVAATVTLSIAVPVIACLPDGGLREFYDATIGYQASAYSPFSIWGQVTALRPLQHIVQVVVVAFGISLAFWPRKRDLRQLAALGAAVIIAVQLTLNHWIYFYVAWFAPLALIALTTVTERATATEPSGEDQKACDDNVRESRGVADVNGYKLLGEPGHPGVEIVNGGAHTRVRKPSD